MAKPRVKGPIILGRQDMSAKGLQVIFRRGTTEEWAASNPVLYLGEPGIDTDTIMMKIGDGISHWEDLDWSSQEEMIRIMLNTPIKE